MKPCVQPGRFIGDENRRKGSSNTVGGGGGLKPPTIMYT
jgi:hypothetical protein